MNIFTYAAPTEGETDDPAMLTLDAGEGGAIVLTVRGEGSETSEPATLTLSRRQVRLLYRVFKSLALDQPILPDGPEAEDD